MVSMYKKAFIFTFMSFFFVASVFIYVQTQQLEQDIKQVDPQILRAERVSNYVTNLEEDYLPLIAEVTARSAIRDIISEAIATNISLIEGEELTEKVFSRTVRGTNDETSFFTNVSNVVFSNWDFGLFWGTEPDDETPCLYFEHGCLNDAGAAHTTPLPSPSTPQIQSCEDFISLIENADVDMPLITLTQDVDCRNTPVGAYGTPGNPFTGTIDGNGFKLRLGNQNQNSLLGVTHGAIIKNLGVILDGQHTRLTRNGGLIGTAQGNTRIENVYVKGDISAGGKYIGGIIGVAEYATITNSYFSGSLTQTKHVKTTSTIGGLVGLADKVIISTSYSAGEIYVEDKGADEAIGGLIGEITGISTVMEDCFSTMKLNPRPSSNVHAYGKSSAGGVTLIRYVFADDDTSISDLDCDLTQALGDGGSVGLCSESTKVKVREIVNPISVDSITKKLRVATEQMLEIPFELEYSSDYFNITQKDPWNLHVTIFFTYQVEDAVSQWRNRSQLVEIDIPIIGLEDPLLYYNGLDIIPRISKSTIAPGNWTAQKLRESITAREPTIGGGDRPTYYYVENKDAPSYLDRLQNKTGPSEYGIELVLHPARMDLVDAYTGDVAFQKPYVDYLFVQDWDCTDAEKTLYQYDVYNGVSDMVGFRLDEEHAQFYLTEAERDASRRDPVCP